MMNQRNFGNKRAFLESLCLFYFYVLHRGLRIKLLKQVPQLLPESEWPVKSYIKRHHLEHHLQTACC